jgi:Phage integrase family
VPAPGTPKRTVHDAVAACRRDVLPTLERNGLPLAYATLLTYGYQLDRLDKALGPKRLSDLTEADVVSFLRRFGRTASTSSVRQQRLTTQKVLAKAGCTVAKDLPTLRGGKGTKKRDAYTPEQIRKLRAQFVGDPLDVGKPTHPRQRVRRSFAGSTPDVQGSVVDALRRRRATQLRQQAAAKPGTWVETGLVFSTATGRMQNKDGVSVWFRRRMARAGLPERSFHELRHTSVTRQIEAGVPAFNCSDWRGHGDATMIIRNYRHRVKGTISLMADVPVGC